MFSFISNARIIRQDIQPGRSIFIGYDVLGLVMLYSSWRGWHGLSPFRTGAPVLEVDLKEVAMLGFIGFYGARVSMWIALARGLRMPQRVEWIVAIVPATITLICMILSGPIERGYAATLGYHYCGRHEDSGTRRWLYTFAARSAHCPTYSKYR